VRASGRDRRAKLSHPHPSHTATATLPECTEQEPNNTPATAQRITLPVIVNGRIVLDNGRHTGERPGVVIRRGSAQ